MMFSLNLPLFDLMSCSTWTLQHFTSFYILTNGVTGFKMSMLDALKTFSMSSKNGMYISSRWAHCLAERKDTWSPGNSQPGEDTVTKPLLVDDNESFIYCFEHTVV